LNITLNSAFRLLYILLDKLSWKKGGRNISWEMFETHWKQVGRVAKLRDKFASIFLRSAAQLEEKWKSSEKAKYCHH
jgi:hypothetical protein